MKIVDTDNYDGDYPDEKVIADNIKRKDFADVMCEALNQMADAYSPRFYKVVQDDYVLRPGFEP
jgi:hypothetical protein